MNHRTLAALTLLCAMLGSCADSGGDRALPEIEPVDEADMSDADAEHASETREPDAASESVDAVEGPDPDGEFVDCAPQQFENLSIPLSDGKALAAFVRRPVDARCRAPTVLLQTPYDKENARSLWFADPTGEPLFESTDYAFVVVDWRGFYGSRDAAVPGEQAPYEQDGYDTVEWIATQTWSDGQVGTWGVSALCGQQYRTATAQPPHLAAAVPIFCQPGLTYEQYYPGGVLRREYSDFIFAYYGAGIIEDHPIRDALWRVVEGATAAIPAKVKTPMLVVAGWYDLYNTGSLRAWQDLSYDSDPTVQHQHRLLVGDWIHFAAGGETEGAGRSLTAQELKYFDTERKIQRDSLAFFDLHMRGIAGEAASWAPVRYVRSGDGSWVDTDGWPPPRSPMPLVLGSDRILGGTWAPGNAIELNYDPDDPSPTVGGQTLMPGLDHGPHDQDAVIAHPEAVVFVSEPLTGPTTILGEIRLDLTVRTTGADTDFAARLTDVDANGTHQVLTDGIHRLKLRDDLGAASPVMPGEAYALSITMTNELAYTFAAGHRIGLIVSSSNHPRFARNPNNGDDFYDSPNAPVAVTNTLVLDGSSVLRLLQDPG